MESTEKLEDIKTMNTAGFVDEKVVKSVESLQRMKRIPSSTIALHDVEKKDSKEHASNHQQRKHSECVQVTHNGRIVYIRKTTAVWLFQEYERVSGDRLFRVRMVQLNSSESQANINQMQSNDDNLPAKHEIVRVGDVCIFQKKNSTDWSMGKVLHFFYHTGKSSKAQ